MNDMIAFKRFSLAVALLSLGLLLMTSDTLALSSGGMGGRPAHPDASNPRTQSIFIFRVNKGESKRDAILVANNSDKPQTVELYGVDGIVTNTGSFTCSQQSESKQDVGSWIAIDKSIVTLGAGETEEVGFELTAPATANVGEHNGCIVFQARDDSSESAGSVRIRTRQAIRVIATIPGELYRNVTIASFTAGTKDNQQRYALTLRNQGNVSADVDAKVWVTSLFGAVVYENGGGYPVLADKRLDLNFENDTPPLFGGWYYAQANITYDSRAGMFGTADDAHRIEKSSTRILIFMTPTIGGMLLMMLAVGVVGGVISWYVVWRRQKINGLQSSWQYIVKDGDTIQSVADTHSIPWRRLASINHIAAPYVLTSGDTLRIPVSETPKNNVLPQK